MAHPYLKHGCQLTYKSPLVKGKHTSTGDGIGAGRKIVPPQRTSGWSRHDKAINELLNLMGADTSIAITGGSRDTVIHDGQVSCSTFGWAQRFNMQHPPIEAGMLTLIEECYDYGEQTGNKLLAPAVLEIIKRAGTREIAIQYSDIKWLSLNVTENGQPIYKEYVIPDEHMVKN